MLAQVQVHTIFTPFQSRKPCGKGGIVVAAVSVFSSVFFWVFFLGGGGLMFLLLGASMAASLFDCVEELVMCVCFFVCVCV